MIKSLTYSRHFRKIMAKEELYLVKLSYPPGDFMEKEAPYENMSLIWDKIDGYWDLYAIYRNDFACYGNNNEKPTGPIQCFENSLLIVKTGESLDYVREVKTDIKIPVAYFNGVIDRNNFIKNNIPFAYYIKAFESRLCAGNRCVSNFENFNCLSSQPLQHIKAINDFYNRRHPDVEKYRCELLDEFQRLEEQKIKNIEEHNAQREKTMEENNEKTAFIKSILRKN